MKAYSIAALTIWLLVFSIPTFAEECTHECDNLGENFCMPGPGFSERAVYGCRENPDTGCRWIAPLEYCEEGFCIEGDCTCPQECERWDFRCRDDFIMEYCRIVDSNNQTCSKWVFDEDCSESVEICIPDSPFCSDIPDGDHDFGDEKPCRDLCPVEGERLCALYDDDAYVCTRNSNGCLSLLHEEYCIDSQLHCQNGFCTCGEAGYSKCLDRWHFEIAVVNPAYPDHPCPAINRGTCPEDKECRKGKCVRISDLAECGGPCPEDGDEEIDWEFEDEIDRDIDVDPELDPDPEVDPDIDSDPDPEFELDHELEIDLDEVMDGDYETDLDKEMDFDLDPDIDLDPEPNETIDNDNDPEIEDSTTSTESDLEPTTNPDGDQETTETATPPDDSDGGDCRTTGSAGWLALCWVAMLILRKRRRARIGIRAGGRDTWVLRLRSKRQP